MNREEELRLAKKFDEESTGLLSKKAHDYADEGDCFSNFKKIALMLDIPVEKTFLMFIVVKVARVVELLKKGKSEVGESIHDTCLDMSNYSKLLDIYMRSENEQRFKK